jgi:DNA invertase Pin-like site-specific DNA recombinase
VTQRPAKAIGYIRTSTDEQHLSPESQERRIRAAAVAYEYDLVDVVRDEDVSSRIPLVEREGGRRIHELIYTNRRRDVDAVIVVRLDRLLRDSEEGSAVVKRLRPKNGQRRPPLNLIALDDHVDLTTAFGRFMVRMRFEIAEFERELIGERTSDALVLKRQTHRIHTGVRYGFDRVGDHSTCEPRRCACRWVENPDEQTVIADVLTWRTGSRPVSLRKIADRLNDAGVPGKLGGRWTPTAVQRVINAAERDHDDDDGVRDTKEGPRRSNGASLDPNTPEVRYLTGLPRDD